jgi:hypothetical protein
MPMNGNAGMRQDGGIRMNVASQWNDEVLGAGREESTAHAARGWTKALESPWTRLTRWWDENTLLCGAIDGDICGDSEQQRTMMQADMVSIQTPRVVKTSPVDAGPSRPRPPAYIIPSVPGEPSMPNTFSPKSTIGRMPSSSPSPSGRTPNRAVPTVLPHTPVNVPADSDAVLSKNGHIYLMDDPARLRTRVFEARRSLPMGSDLPTPRSSGYVAFRASEVSVLPDASTSLLNKQLLCSLRACAFSTA